MTTATKTSKTTSKPATKETSAKETSAKETKAKAMDSNALTQRQRAVLQALAKEPMNRKALATATGQQKGWASLLGASTKGTPAPTTMVGRGWVSVSANVPFVYTLTSAGKAMLESAAKPAAKASAAKAK
jgi:phage protein D